jgi:hypothetical protein
MTGARGCSILVCGSGIYGIHKDEKGKQKGKMKRIKV